MKNIQQNQGAKSDEKCEECPSDELAESGGFLQAKKKMQKRWDGEIGGKLRF